MNTFLKSDRIRKATARLALPLVLCILAAVTIAGAGCATSALEPYPQSHLQLLGVFSDKECTKPISMFDFGTIGSGYNKGIVIPICIKNLTDQRLKVTASQSFSCPGLVSLEAAPPRFYSDREIDPDQVGKFFLRMNWVGSIPAQDYEFTVTLTAEWDEGGGFVIVFPSKLKVLEWAPSNAVEPTS